MYNGAAPAQPPTERRNERKKLGIPKRPGKKKERPLYAMFGRRKIPTRCNTRSVGRGRENGGKTDGETKL